MFKREAEWEDEKVVHLYSDHKYITDQDRQRALETTMRTGKIVKITTRPRGIRRWFPRLFG